LLNNIYFRSLSPALNDPSGSIALYNGHSGYNSEGSIVRGRTILSARRSSNDDSYVASSENYDASGGSGNNNNNNNNNSLITTYPYLQCVAYINKTHSQR
jgi:hypothetical protein